MQALRRTFPDKPPPLDVEVTVDEPHGDPAAEWEPEANEAIEGVETPLLVDMKTGEVLEDPAAALGIGEPDPVPEPPKPEGPFGVAGPAMPDPGAQDFGFANVGDLMTYANNRWGSSATDILGALGVEKPGQITNPNDARRQLDLLWGDKE